MTGGAGNTGGCGFGGVTYLDLHAYDPVAPAAVLDDPRRGRRESRGTEPRDRSGGFRQGGAPHSGTLPALPFGDNEEDEEAVREGTGAIRVYQDLIFDAHASEADRINRRQLLLQYCQLDTAAMVMIWAHWTGSYDFRPD